MIDAGIPRQITVAIPTQWFQQLLRRTLEREGNETLEPLFGCDWHSAAGGRMVFANFHDGGELRIVEEDR